MNKNKLCAKERTNFKLTRPLTLNMNSWTTVIPMFLVVAVVVMKTKMVTGANADLNCISSEECGDGQICYMKSGEQSGFCRMQGTGNTETSVGVEKNLQSDDKKNYEKSHSAGIQSKRDLKGDTLGDVGGVVGDLGDTLDEENPAGMPRILIRLLNALKQTQARFKSSGPKYH